MAQVRLTKEERRRVGECREYIESVRDRLQGEYDEKTEKWQESDAGSEAQTLIDLVEAAANAVEEVEGC